MEKELKPADYKANINYGQVDGMRQIKKAYFSTDETSTEEAIFNGVESVINVLAGFNCELVEIVPIFFQNNKTRIVRKVIALKIN